MGKLVTFFKGLNMLIGAFLAFIGVWKIVTLEIFQNLGSQFFQIFMPFFLILFGVCMIIAEVKKEFGSEYFGFFRTFLGRGIFNLFLASLSVYQVESDTSEVIGYVYGLILFICGIMYIGFHFCSPSGKLGEVKKGFDFCSILNFLGAIFFVILAFIVDSGSVYQEWKITDQDSSRNALYISAIIHFGLFVIILAWKHLKQYRAQKEQARFQNGPTRYFNARGIDDDSDIKQSLQPISINS